jgi:glycerol kinase
VGLSSPYWDSDARAEIINISRGTKKAHIVRSAEESIAYQIKDVVENMNGEVGFALQELRVDGGPTRDEFVMQFLSDILDVPVIRSKTEELSGTGAMYMGGLALGIWNTYDEIESMRKVEKRFVSSMDIMVREKNYKGWQSAVSKVLTKERR